jgi:hypothetical protein
MLSFWDSPLKNVGDHQVAGNKVALSFLGFENETTVEYRDR